LEREEPETARMLERLYALPRDTVATTVVTYEEQMRGWLAYVARAVTIPQIVHAYGRLAQHVASFQGIPILPFDEASGAIYDGLLQARLRVGTLDLRIAAIVLSNGGTLLSRNLADFRRVPDLRVEDWSTWEDE
jgi:tRNA(fMet)-specific endonuclease VapC